MTTYLDGDEARTVELMQARDGDRSWLRHRGCAAEVDRRLLAGAFEDELAEARDDWKNHVRHLRNEHRIDVRKDERGTWRIVGVLASADASRSSPLADDGRVGSTENGEGTATDADASAGTSTLNALAATDLAERLMAVPELASAEADPARIAVTAKAIAALARSSLLHDPALKDSVALFIRQASESSHWHNCAHYRSRSAANIIAGQSIRTAAQYQAWCRSNLHHEHIVPGKVIYDLLRSIDATDEGIVRLVLRRFSLRATITEAQDGELRKAGLRSAMPSGFYSKGDPLFLDPLARYKATELIADLEPRTRARWFED